MARARPKSFVGRELAFRVRGEVFSLPAADVLEVIRLPAITRVPLAPEALAGVINFHGAAIPVMRLDRLARIDGAATASTRVIVYQADEPVGLLVDDIVQLEQGAAGRGKARSLDIAALLSAYHGRGAGVVPHRDAPTSPPVVVAPAAKTHTLLEFAIAGQSYALPIAAIREVTRLPSQIAELKGAGEAALGVIELRGRVVPVVSLAALLGIEQAGATAASVIVTEIGPFWVGLLTGSMDKILRLSDDAIEAVPPLLQRGRGTAEIDGIGRLDGGRALVSILSPAKLFANELVAEALSRADQKEESLAEAEATIEQFVVLNFGDERFGLPIKAIDEIVQLPSAITRLPKAPAFVAGLINLRGRPLPLIDQRKRFASAVDQSERRARVVVMTVDGVQAGFIVGGVSEIVGIAADKVRATPQMPGDGGRTFDRVAPLGHSDELMLLVDPKELLNQAERDLLAHLKLEGGSAKP